MAKNLFAPRAIYVLLLTLFLTGCGSLASTIEVGSTASSTATDRNLKDVLHDLPLRQGNTWVYSATYYDTFHQTTRITATYQITETVTHTEIHPSYFIAMVVQEKSMMDSSIDLDKLDPNWHLYYLDGKDGTKTYWYAISGTQVYRQESRLDFSTIESSWLEYVFPLSEKTRWYPDPEQRKLFSDIDIGPSSGLRVVSETTDQHVPAGDFTNCREIRTIYLSGGTRQWFCAGIGIVSREYDHMGTPLGHKVLLIHYTAQPQNDSYR